MNEDLKERIIRAYPSGTEHELDESALESEERDSRIRNAMESIKNEFPLVWHVDIFNKPAYQIGLIHRDQPSFESWVWQMNNENKLAWIKANGGQPYTVLWLRISRVADFFYSYFNHWVPRGDTGYLDADCRREPDVVWAGYQESLSKRLVENGFNFLTDELAREPTPFVTEVDYWSIPEDDPRWNDDDFEPAPIPSSVHQCLFKH